MMKKTKKIIIFVIRAGFFVLYPALFSAAFTGVKSIIMTISEHRGLEWNSFVATLVALLLVTMVFGRIFCGFACAFGTYGDFLYFLSSWIRKKQKKRPFHVLEKQGKYLKYLKYLILFGILAFCAMGMSGAVSENSPWTAFSRLQSMKLPESVIGVGMFLLLSVGMFLEPRFFCRFFCPMGAIFSMMPVLPFAQVRRTEKNCAPGCRLCTKICPAGISIPDVGTTDSAGMGECFACRKCMQGCPRRK
jgi:polyferredoxin